MKHCIVMEAEARKMAGLLRGLPYNYMYIRVLETILTCWLDSPPAQTISNFSSRGPSSALLQRRTLAWIVLTLRIQRTLLPGMQSDWSVLTLDMNRAVVCFWLLRGASAKSGSMDR